MEQEKKEIILHSALNYVRNLHSGDTGGHDLDHVMRVRSLSLQIADKEAGADLFVTELIALLHDTYDWKLSGDSDLSKKSLMEWASRIGLEEDYFNNITTAIDGIAYKGALVQDTPLSLEGEIVRDADRLDAMGAIGIARAFAYGGSRKRKLYSSDEIPENHKSFAEYKANNSSTMGHFYEKLLLLKDRLRTETGKEMGDKRHLFMEEFIRQFMSEWEAGNKG
jgi:uncharacterized protein